MSIFDQEWFSYSCVAAMLLLCTISGFIGATTPDRFSVGGKIGKNILVFNCIIMGLICIAVLVSKITELLR